MCTAITYQTRDFYFGRTLDYDCSFSEAVTVTPRNFPLSFRCAPTPKNRYAIIGMAHVRDNYPLYYDAANEKGLAVAGLNFVGNADYKKNRENRDNICHFELIPWLLCQCATVREAAALLERINLTDTPFSPQLPPAQLHWLIADRNEAITLEALRDGIRIHPNPVGVLTNNPPFDQQLRQLCRYMQLSPEPPVNLFSRELKLEPDSRGMGAMGLPGDLSSASRFVRAAFTKLNSLSGEEERESVSQFFHILGTVEQVRGCCRLPEGRQEITLYTSCCNASRGIYYYTTYGNRQITAVSLHGEDPDGTGLIQYPLAEEEQIRFQNGAQGLSC